MQATEELIRYASGLTFDQLPSQTVDDIKIHILDTLGAIVAGSRAPATGRLVDLIKQWGGREEATILGYGYRVPAPHAALVNSMMSRGFDFETILAGGATHVSASVIPAAMALAEYAQTVNDKPVSGKDLMAAIVLGVDLNWRFRVAGGPSTIMSGGWLAETFAPPAIAAMGGILLGLTPEQINFAMGIGYNQCCGTYGATVGDHGGLMAQLSQGLGAKAGVLAALMAAIGFTACKDIVDGQWGIYKMYGNGSYDADILTGALGKRFKALTPGIKKYPGCGATQPVVSCTLALLQEHHLSAADIDSIRLTVGENSYFLCGANKMSPLNPADALWNYRYSMAVACVKGKVFVDDFTAEAVEDPEVNKFIPKIDVYPDKGLRHQVRVEMTTRSGQTFFKGLDDMEPVGKPETIEKFKKCCGFAINPIGQDSVDRSIDMVQHLEKISDIGELVGLLVPLQ